MQRGFLVLLAIVTDADEEFNTNCLLHCPVLNGNNPALLSQIPHSAVDQFAPAAQIAAEIRNKLIKEWLGGKLIIPKRVSWSGRLGRKKTSLLVLFPCCLLICLIFRASSLVGESPILSHNLMLNLSLSCFIPTAMLVHYVTYVYLCSQKPKLESLRPTFCPTPDFA